MLTLVFNVKLLCGVGHKLNVCLSTAGLWLLQPGSECGEHTRHGLPWEGKIITWSYRPVALWRNKQVTLPLLCGCATIQWFLLLFSFVLFTLFFSHYFSDVLGGQWVLVSEQWDGPAVLQEGLWPGECPNLRNRITRVDIIFLWFNHGLLYIHNDICITLCLLNLSFYQTIHFFGYLIHRPQCLYICL